MGHLSDQVGSISLSTPSFEIRGASGRPSTPRWDRIDSRSLIAQARRIYFAYLSAPLRGRSLLVWWWIRRNPMAAWSSRPLFFCRTKSSLPSI